MSSSDSSSLSRSELQSRAARAVYWIGPPVAVLLTLVQSPPTAALLPVIGLPTIYAVRKYKALPLKIQSNFETCFWIYTFSSTPGMVAAIAGQSTLFYGFFYQFYGSETMAFLKEFGARSSDGVPAAVIAARAAAAWSWRNVVQRAWFTYIIAGVWEEGVKYLPAAYALRRTPASDLQTRRHTVLQYAIASGLGFGTMELFLFVFGAAVEGDRFPALLLAVIERLVVGSPSHVLLTSLFGLRMLRYEAEAKDDQKSSTLGKVVTFFKALAPSMFYHGSSNFALMSISAMNGNVGWVHPTDTKSLVTLAGLIGGLMGMLAWHVRREWRLLKEMEKKQA